MACCSLGGSLASRLLSLTVERLRERMLLQGADSGEINEARRLLEDPASTITSPTTCMCARPAARATPEDLPRGRLRGARWRPNLRLLPRARAGCAVEVRVATDGEAGARLAPACSPISRRRTSPQRCRDRARGSVWPRLVDRSAICAPDRPLRQRPVVAAGGCQQPARDRDCRSLRERERLDGAPRAECRVLPARRRWAELPRPGRRKAARAVVHR
jgi:hypothetical protein